MQSYLRVSEARAGDIMNSTNFHNARGESRVIYEHTQSEFIALQGPKHDLETA